MKRIVIIFVGALIVGIFTLLMVVTSQPIARVHIRALAPTGASASYWEDSQTQVQIPVWRFAVSNEGTATAYWFTCVRYKEIVPISGFSSGGLGHFSGKSLSPKEGTTVDMPVPVNTNWLWCGMVTYGTQRSAIMENILKMEMRIPLLWRLDPNWGFRDGFDAWRGTTNFSGATPANTP
jgi:hypothetical protein